MDKRVERCVAGDVSFHSRLSSAKGGHGRAEAGEIDLSSQESLGRSGHLGAPRAAAQVKKPSEAAGSGY